MSSATVILVSRLITRPYEISSPPKFLHTPLPLQPTGNLLQLLQPLEKLGLNTILKKEILTLFSHGASYLAFQS